MSKASRSMRKQSSYGIKKSFIKTTKNIFIYDEKFQTILPRAIYNKLLHTTEFAISLVEEYIGQPQTQGVKGLQLMKLALIDQSAMMKELKINLHERMDTENVPQVQNPQEQAEQIQKNHITETKQSINQINQMNSHTENDYEDNIFLPLDSLINEPKRQYNVNDDGHDFFHFEERNFNTSIPPHEELDILSLID